MGNCTNCNGIQVSANPYTLQNGLNGREAFLYYASADNSSGLNFTYPGNDSQPFKAFLSTDTEIVSPALSDFAGTFFQAVGSNGVNGTNGSNGNFGGVSAWYQFSSANTAADPGTGFLKFDNADLSLASALYIDSNDINNNTQDAFISLTGISSAATKSYIMISSKGNPGAFVIFACTAAVNNSGWWTLTVSAINGSSSTPFTDLSSVIISVSVNGADGATGSTGSNGTDAVISSTSTSNLTVALGTQLLDTATQLTLVPGSWVLLSDTANPGTVQMIGQIVTVGGGSPNLVLNVTQGIGFGSASTSWNVSLTDEPRDCISTTSQTVVSYGLGTQNFTTDTVLNLLPGANIMISDPANPGTNYMLGKLTAISGLNISVNVTFDSVGAGSNNPWNIQLDGEPNKGLSSEFLEITKTVSSTDVQALNSVSQILIPGQGPGKAVQFIEGTAKLKWNANTYSNNSNIQLIGGSTGIVYGEFSGNIFFEGTNAIYNLTLPLLTSSTVPLGLNEDIYLFALGVDPGAPGDSNITFNCTYKVSQV